MRRLFSAIIVVLVGLTTIGSPSYAADSIKIFLYNKQIKTDAAPIIKNQSTLVPLRAVAEALQADVSWDPQKNTVTIRKWSEIITLTVGKTIGVQQGNPNQSETFNLVAPVQKINSHVFVPLRFISEHFGYKVSWKDRAVFIESPLTAEDTEIVTKGSLESARQLMINLSQNGTHYLLKPLVTKYDNHDFSTTFLFPEGEALRFYVIKDGIISFVTYKNDFLVSSWQAYIGQGDGLKQFLDRKFTDPQGEEQEIDKTFLYSSSGMFGEGSYSSSGKLDLDDTITVLGHRSMFGNEITQETGKIELKLADEVRKEEVNP